MKKHKIAIIIGVLAVLVLIVVVAVIYVRNGKKATEPIVSKTYVEEDYDFQVTYPSDWNISDELSPGSCCLFIASWNKKSTFEPNASGTPVEKITATENIKVQIGNYDKKINDPFKAASTTKVMLGSTEFYKGVASDGMEFYLLPRSETEGVGAAIFAYIETTEDYKKTARDIVATIKLLPVTATSTVITSPSVKK